MSYNVKLIPSGKTFEVEPGEKILRAALGKGLSLPYGCLMGTCSTCMGVIKEGDFDFGNANPHYLTDAHRAGRMAMLCQATACSDLEIEIEELPPLPQPGSSVAIVKKLDRVADDVIVMNLRLPLHQTLIFLPGQYVDIVLPGGERRSYSIANASALPMGVLDLQLHVRHLAGGLFTDRLFAGDVKQRDKISLEGPLGTFFLRDSDKPIIMVASGTGYAPIRSMLLDMFARKNPRQCTLYWGGRSRKDIYAMDEVAGWAEEYSCFRFVPVLSEPLPDDAWSGRTGFVHAAVMQDHPDLSGHQVYACGAPVMVSSARTDFASNCGLQEAEFFADSFVSSADGGISKDL
ncbi:CDP-6-deoxy-delta-3,4-glucoseen reductase [Pseudoxanthomonas jiangsuensis]|uniref:2Fe-2S iron-sulfur cluster-binding protein n=1 Tax=Pseudoxanthomonas jiangsuensis TaxID=619688 RepID=UPI00139159F6|nr:2Fe-2S iron-sulfur cluster-binding protein [Pseudoxanthomonas jiangsuensis]KAF1697265.1 CDP-6-deoxy-delta-3,4-glucoseen reductase [Pseudoxanthomonas jiangsuensis]